MNKKQMFVATAGPCFAVLVVAMAHSSLLSPALAQEGARNAAIRAVPAKQPVVLDGELKEWDWSAAIDSVYDPILAPRFTGQYALQYDAEAFYFAAKITDETPLLNVHDPLLEADKAWDGDAIQIRLTAAPEMPYPVMASTFNKDAASIDDRIVHLTMWYFTPTKTPCLQISRGMDYHGGQVLTGAKAGSAYKVWPDGKGYNVEVRLPWGLLGVKTGQKPPRAADKTALTVQTLWSNTDGTRQIMSLSDVVTGAGFHFQSAEKWGQVEFLAKGELPAAARPLSVTEVAAPLSLEVPVPDPQARMLSIALRNSQGETVRTLPSIDKPAIRDGKVQVRWDGLDDDGRVLPPGKYTASVLTHRGVDTKWVTSVHNPGVPTWKTGDGTGAWGGDHGPPLAAASDGNQVYLGWVFSEAGFSIVGASKDLVADKNGELRPRKLWGAGNPLDVGMLSAALATNGQYLFVGQDGRTYGTWKEKKDPNRPAVWLADIKTGRPVPLPFGKRYLLLPTWQEADVADGGGAGHGGNNLTGLAVRGDFLFATLRRSGKVIQYNWKSGAMVREYAVTAPGGVVASPDGTLRLATPAGLMKLNPATGVLATLSAGLEDPQGLAQGADGTLFVADRGKAMQVKVFTADGKPLGSIGKTGGRAPVGRFDPNGMYLPNGIAVDGDGKVWVTEQDNSPRRVSVWKWDAQRKQGALYADLIGPGTYAVRGEADPEKPNLVTTMGTLFDVDYATGAVKTLATPIRESLKPLQIGLVGEGMPAGGEIRRVKGRTYYVQSLRHMTVVSLLDEKTWLASPVAALLIAPGGWFQSGVETEKFPPDQQAAVKKIYAASNRILWTDRNSNHAVEPEELVALKNQNSGYYWGAHVDRELTLWSGQNYGDQIWRLPVTEWLADGTPVYGDLLKPEGVTPTLKIQAGGLVPSYQPDAAGKSIYVIASGPKGEADPYQSISKYKLDGTKQWDYRRTWINFALTSPLYQPGMVIGAMKVIGTVQVPGGPEIVGVNGYMGQFNLLSDDGLWVAALGSDNRYSPANSEKTYFVENFSGSIYADPRSGKFYLMAGETDTRISEITGLDTIKRGQFPLAVSDGDAARVRLAMERRQAKQGGPVTLPMAKITPQVDGDLKEWTLPDTNTIDAGAGRTARVALGYDATHFSIAIEVRDDSPLKNAGGDEALLFKTGDSVNVNLAVDSAANPNRAKPVAGDLRLLFTETPDGPITVVYEPVVKAGQAKNERTFASPTGSLIFDSVRTLVSARLKVTRRVNANTYSLEASVPLAELGFVPQSGQKYKGDVGVLFSTPGGNAVGVRSYLFNKDTSITQDVPSEARLEPNKWGTLVAQ